MQLLALLAAAASTALAIPHGAHSHAGKESSWGLKTFKNLVAFGDSYTDESRLGYFQQHGGQGPPPGTLLPESTSTPGGGITWPRWVSIYSGANLFNYAVSGAVCSNKQIYRYLDSISGPFPDVLGYEVPAFIADTKFVDATTKKNTLYKDRTADNTVYSMWIGTNDLGNGALLTDSTIGGTTLEDYVDCIFDAFDGIYSTGGRNFVLMNVAPLELSPLYGMPKAGGLTWSQYWPDKSSNITEISSKMKEYSTAVNAIFTYRIPYETALANRYPGASFALYDVHALFKDIYYNPKAYLNGTTAANVTGFYHHCTDYSHCVDETKQDKDSFLWYDELHPSQRADQIVASNFLDVVKGKSEWATYW